MKKIKVYSGETIKNQVERHPIEYFNESKQIIENIIKSTEDITYEIETNSPDYVSALYYLSEKTDIKCELYLNGVLSTLDDIFGDFNRFYDLLDKECEKYY
jgi:hypothetical protein